MERTGYVSDSRVKECVRFPDYSAPPPVDGSAPTTGRFQIFCGGKRVGYGDPDTGIWDGEDKTMTYIDTINGTVEAERQDSCRSLAGV